MALYRAGAAAFERDEHGRADQYLSDFLKNYDVADGWTKRAQEMLQEMRNR